MMAMRDEEAVATLEDVLMQMDEIARALRSLRNERIRAYCLADFEGREGGWLGRFVRDVLEEELRRYRGQDEEDED
jgi:hypothetical protein